MSYQRRTGLMRLGAIVVALCAVLYLHQIFTEDTFVTNGFDLFVLLPLCTIGALVVARNGYARDRIGRSTDPRPILRQDRINARLSSQLTGPKTSK